MHFGIQGRKAIVCGASRGLGRSCAEALASEGVRVWIVARSRDALELAAKEMNGPLGYDVRTVVADVSLEAGRRAILDACPDPDILVNNAGSLPAGDFRSFGRDDWIRAVDGSMVSAIELIRATIDGMIERHFGRILNVTSCLVKSPVGLFGLSNGVRSGLAAFASGLARDVARHNVTINNLLPGQFDTERLLGVHEALARSAGEATESVRQSAREQIPAGRFGAPEEFGAACAFLCSDLAGYITGQNLLIDGGQFPGA